MQQSDYLTQSEYPGATLDLAIDSSGACHFDQSNVQLGLKWIVIHGTAGGLNPVAIAEYFKTVPSSTHYVIGQDGTVVQCVPENCVAWGNGDVSVGCMPWWNGIDPNQYTISIEHVKPNIDNSDQLTADQQDASFKLVDYLCTKHGIQRKMGDATGGIVPHSSMDPVNRSRCPGPYPWDQLISYLNPNQVPQPMPLPTGWNYTSTGDLLGPPVGQNANRYIVTRGFRSFMLQGGTWWLGAPTANEFTSQDVHMNTTDFPGSLQPFTYGWLVWRADTQEIYPLQSGDVIKDLLTGSIPASDITKIGYTP